MEGLKGKIIEIKGGVSSIKFIGEVPPIGSILSSEDGKYTFEVVEIRSKDTVNAVLLSPAVGAKRNMVLNVKDGGSDIPLGKEILGRMFDLFGKPIDDKGKVELKKGFTKKGEI